MKVVETLIPQLVLDPASTVVTGNGGFLVSFRLPCGRASKTCLSLLYESSTTRLQLRKTALCGHALLTLDDGGRTNIGKDTSISKGRSFNEFAQILLASDIDFIGDELRCHP